MMLFLAWYAAAFVVILPGIVPAMALFKRLPSGGLLLARPIGLLLTAETAWLISTLTPIPYGLPLIVSVTVSLCCVGLWVLWRNAPMREAIAARYRVLVAGEVCFIAIFAAIAITRSWTPAALLIEKPMELMMLTAVNGTNDMPPPDLWLSGFDLSYYYLGFVMIDVLQRISGTPPSHALTLGFASTIALAVAALGGLVGDVLWTMPRRRLALVAIGVAVASLSAWTIAIAESPFRLDAEGLAYHEWLSTLYESSNPLSHEYLGWWWLTAPAALSFSWAHPPSYVVVLGDLHSHTIAMPLLVGGIAIAVDALRHTDDSPLRWVRQPAVCGLLVLIFAGIAMTSIWDAATCGLLWFAAVTARSVVDGRSVPQALLRAAALIAPVAVLATLVAAPMMITFNAPVPHISLSLPAITPPFNLLRFWGALFVPIAVAVLIIRPPLPRALFGRFAVVALIPFLLMILVGLSVPTVNLFAIWGFGGFATAIVVALLASALGAMAAHALRDGDVTDATWLAIAAAGTCIILLMEVFMISGGHGLTRLNTLLKFTFPAWLLLACAGGIGVARAAPLVPREIRRIRAARRHLRGVTAGLACVLAGAAWLSALAFFPMALADRVAEGQARGFDSLAYLADADPGAIATAAWAHEHLDPDNHILIETVSKSFHFGNVVASASGIPTLIAWPDHEMHWRTDPPLAQRAAAVRAIYRRAGDEVAVRIAHWMGVTHVYIGLRERAVYGPIVDNGFERWPIVFEAFGGRVVAVPDPPAGGNE